MGNILLIQKLFICDIMVLDCIYINTQVAAFSIVTGFNKINNMVEVFL